METFFIEGHEMGEAYRRASDTGGLIIVPGGKDQAPIRIRSDLGKVSS